MCVVCPIVFGSIVVGGIVVKAVKQIITPKPEPLPVAVYGEDLED